MKLILRPAIPPWSLIIRKKASEHFAMVPSAETGPLSDVVHPILISVAVTPGVSSAREARLPATAMAPAAAEPANSERRLSEVICFSPGLRRASAANLAQSPASVSEKVAVLSCVYTPRRRLRSTLSRKGEGKRLEFVYHFAQPQAKKDNDDGF